MVIASFATTSLNAEPIHGALPVFISRDRIWGMRVRYRADDWIVRGELR